MRKRAPIRAARRGSGRRGEGVCTGDESGDGNGGRTKGGEADSWCNGDGKGAGG